MASFQIAILPYGHKAGYRLARVPLAALHWPLGRPVHLDGTVGDLTTDDHLIVYPSRAAMYLPRPGVRCNVSLAIAEPYALHFEYYRVVRILHRRFHRVLTFNRTLLARLPNSAPLVFGTTWIADREELDLTKTKNVSLIASSKRKLPGHRLRHAIVRNCRRNGIAIDALGRAYKPIEEKSEGLAAYRYSVVIENSREPGYFTEKLIDAIACETIPIYWGAPDIADYFDTRGMIICTNRQQILDAAATAGPEDYETRVGYARNNIARAKPFFDYEKNAVTTLAAEINMASREWATGGAWTTAGLIPAG